MGYPIAQGNTAQPLFFLMVLSSDHITGATGQVPTVTIRKVGQPFASPAGAVTEVANGWYQVAANASDADTLGPILLHATAGGCDPCDDDYIVEFDATASSAILSPSSTSALAITGLDLVKRAMKRLNVLAAGEEPSPEDAADGLECLNDLVDALNAERLMIPTVARTLFPLVTSVQTYTIGAGGDFDMPWPNSLDGAGIVWTTGTTILEWPVAVLDPQAWQRVGMKSLTAPWPRAVYYQRTHPLGLLSTVPMMDGSQSSVQLALYTQAALSQFVSLTTQYTFQPGYLAMLRDNLAVDFASYFEVEAPDSVQRSAVRLKANVKTSNMVLTDMDLPSPFSGGFYSINDDSVYPR